MKEKLLETDTLEEYKKIHKKKYEERLMIEKEMLEKQKTEEETNEKIKKEQAYKQLQIEKDKEYSIQYYHEINNLQRTNTTSADSNLPMLNSYTERLINTPHYAYMPDVTSHGLLDNGSGEPISQRIRNFFSSRNPRQYLGRSRVQIICNIILFIFIITCIAIFAFL
ncbi:hypothetical protein, conserved [Plasmodium gonderi]|uniref:Uncharacterized protein n=1 Tax=Plasmodium gonderi TaxID=77519 RepID=A0A1Y1JLD4_PLAGO|nr:hypothetical protein, conserved [Plasmodium gonderi]GAW81223.1 hypothetical protein, conserved [Plasmodium gonderi]